MDNHVAGTEPYNPEEKSPLLKDCWNCKKLVDEDEIKSKTNDLCIECQNIKFCLCGIPANECKFCE